MWTVTRKQLWVGNPGKYVRDLSEVEKRWIVEQAEKYHYNAERHMEEFHLPYPMDAVWEGERAGYKMGWKE